jgi:hypothetical protein
LLWYATTTPVLLYFCFYPRYAIININCEPCLLVYINSIFLSKIFYMNIATFAYIFIHFIYIVKFSLRLILFYDTGGCWISIHLLLFHFSIHFVVLLSQLSGWIIFAKKKTSHQLWYKKKYIRINEFMFMMCMNNKVFDNHQLLWVLPGGSCMVCKSKMKQTI